MTAADLMEEERDYANQYKNHFKLGGFKIFLDGSPQGRTAWMSEPYERDAAYCGYPIHSDKAVSYTHLDVYKRQSGDYLNRIVKKFSGHTITRYCQKIALQQARTLLIETDKSVAAVMEELGFKNSTHFYELYKEEFGILPSESRKEQNQNV